MASENHEKMYHGFTDYGEHLENVERICQKEWTESKLANKVLQFMFNGYHGFRFPLCHFPIIGMDARQLTDLIDQAITALEHFGFHVSKDFYSFNRSINQ